MAILEATIRGTLYTPMVGKVYYSDGEVGIPLKASEEERVELRTEYTVASPMSPWALGWANWSILEKLAAGRAFSEVFTSEVDFAAKKITINWRR